MSQTKTIRMGCARLYTIIAILTFNTLVLFIVGLIALHIVLPQPQQTVGPSGISNVFSPYFKPESYQFSTDEQARIIGLEFDTWAQNGHWQVHPWTALTSRDFVGELFNIDGDGIRRTTPPDAQYDEKQPIRIWMFGGSTMFGWGLPDDWTIPSILQRELQSRLPDYQIQVTNFGVPIYGTSQELALFIANLRIRPQPHAVVFMDGLNDVWFAMNTNSQTTLPETLSLAWEQEIRDLTTDNQAWVTFKPAFPLNRLGIPFSQGSVGARYAMQFTFDRDPDKRLGQTIITYRFNRKTITDIANTNGILPLFLLQPWEDEEFYPTFLGGVGNHPHTVDITTILDDVEYPIHVDDFHYSDYASQIIANVIADELIDRDLTDFIE